MGRFRRRRIKDGRVSGAGPRLDVEDAVRLHLIEHVERIIGHGLERLEAAQHLVVAVKSRSLVHRRKG